MNRPVALSTRIAPFALFAGLAVLSLPAMGKQETGPAPDPVAVERYLSQLENGPAKVVVQKPTSNPGKRRSIENVVETVTTRTPSGSVVNGIEGFLAN